ncbi:hypothetical protein M409DRAFT_23000 [Zasmidium cellare ATCC 36951]|uniref:Cytochrome P450 n=1 Tax=Zasmidium cellare ATCC 36951 TaxID=1080233 RepID=A0A6A6CK19_ZASCE|nr:uncharacterized protein M409DRAFT_23000 [Zasmidium cellare ATCC 36951]KAF2166953.1 hypothetical protein M409DRAFT_23000 [Zasmidium cellare ATCC 36951]
MSGVDVLAPTGLTISHLVFAAGVLAATALVWWNFYVLFLDPLRDVPGPFWARWTRLWLLNEISSGQSHLTFPKLHDQYGPVVRITPDLYSFNSPEDQKKIYKLKDPLAKTAYYETGGDPGVPNIFTICDEKEHSDRRRRIASLYTMTSMVHYEEPVDRMNALCVKKFEQFAKQKKRVNIPQFMQYYAFDVIGEISIDSSFGMMENEGDVDNMVKIAHSAAVYQGHVGIVPEIHPLFFQLRKMLGYLNGGSATQDLVNRQLENHHQALKAEKTDPKQEPFITKILKLKDSGKVDDLHIFDAIGGNLAAGSDTTGITLAAVFYYLYRNPDKLATLRREIDDGAAVGEVSDPVTFKEAQNLQYLGAVIEETLRIHSAAGYILERTVPKGGVELASRFFPEGTHVGCQSWALHRNKEVYGADADEFRPERFLEEGNPATTVASFAFGGGTRACIGKNISLLELSKVIPQIVRRFDLVFVDEKPWELYTSWFVFARYSCEVRLRGE